MTIQDLDTMVEAEEAIIEATVEVGVEVDRVALVSTTMRRQVRIHTTYASLVCLTSTCFIFYYLSWSHIISASEKYHLTR